jgi:hypothetical protein
MPQARPPERIFQQTGAAGQPVSQPDFILLNIISRSILFTRKNRLKRREK